MKRSNQHMMSQPEASTKSPVLCDFDLSNEAIYSDVEDL